MNKSEGVIKEGRRIFLTRGTGNGHSATISSDGTIVRNAWNDELTGQPLSTLVGESAASGGLHSLLKTNKNGDGENTIRISNHGATARTFQENSEDGNIVSVVIESPRVKKHFIESPDVDAVEYVFKRDGLNREKLAALVYDISNFLANGEYDDHIGADYVHYSGSPEFKEEAKVHVTAINAERTRAEKVLFQSDQTTHRGAMTMDDDWKATIALFEGSADGSTVIHETAHFIFNMMEKFVKNGLADERMQSDYKKLVDWMTLTPEQAAKGYEAYLKTVREGTDAMTLEQWKYIEEKDTRPSE